MSLMALDIGERRIGIAVSESGVLATPHSILYRTSKKEDFTRLGRLIAELEVEAVIVGLPYSLSDGEREGPQARRIKRYTEALAETVAVPVKYFDESYSTVEAHSYRAASGGRNTAKKKKHIDDVAAAVILQNYLNATSPAQNME